MAKLPPRETVGKTVCVCRHCTDTATVKRDAGGFLFMTCPSCGTINNRRPAFQAALQTGMDVYNDTQAQQKNAPPPDQHKASRLFGNLFT